MAERPLTDRAREFVRWRLRRLGALGRSAKLALLGARLSRVFEEVDPRVRYPSYKSLDAFCDVERLRGLDGYVRERVERTLRDGGTTPFDTGPLRRNPLHPMRPGTRIVPLTASSNEGQFQYFELDDPERWSPTPQAEVFAELMDFVATLPFQATGRIIVMCDDGNHAVPMHRDHRDTNNLHEFVWFRTNLDKPFFLTDRQRQGRVYIRSHTAWFDTVNQFHGADAVPRPTLSIRVDGRFTEEFRARIPKPPFNAASTPSFWASVEGVGTEAHGRATRPAGGPVPSGPDALRPS